MASNSSLNTPYILLGGTLLVAVALFFLVIQPMISDINSTQEEISTQTARLRERQEFLNTIDRKLAVLQTQLAHEERLAVILPTSERLEDALRVIHQSAGVSGLVVQSIGNDSAKTQGAVNAQRARGENPEVPSEVSVLLLTVDFAGTYQQLRSMLTELEKSPRLMDVVSVEMGRSAASPDQVAGSLHIQSYVQQPPNTNEL